MAESESIQPPKASVDLLGSTPNEASKPASSRQGEASEAQPAKAADPTVDSSNLDERIAARRLRIQRRIAALKRAEQGDEDDFKAKMDLELSRGEKQAEASRVRLEKLVRDGNELVSNIFVASRARENQRRRDEEVIGRQRKERLEAEAKSSGERFEEISKKWELAVKIEIPQELHARLRQHQLACDALIEEKNKVVTDLGNELKHKDELYVQYIKKHGEDIDLQVERMEEEVRQVWKAMREELDEVERAYQQQRSELLTGHRAEWESTMSTRRSKELEYLEHLLKRVEDYENQLHQLRVQDAEEYNATKIRLENEVQRFQQELQQMKATYQLNQEKLEYNFQILRKRDEENTVTKSLQKRKITKLHDNLNNLRQKLAKQEKQYKDENLKLVDDYKHVVEQLLDLQNKSKHFLEADMATFTDLWLLNEAEAKRLTQRILDTERTLREQQLGLPGELPAMDLSFLKNDGPIKTKQGSEQAVAVKARDVLLDVMQEQPDSEANGARADSRQLRSELLKQVDMQAILRVLNILCDESGFLVENKLWTLLQPLPKTDQNLMKLDSIFHALGIETDADIKRLVEYFMVLKEEPQAPATAALEGPADGAATTELSRVSSGTQRLVSRVDGEGEGEVGEEGAAGGPPSRAPSGTAAGEARSTRSAASASAVGGSHDVPEVLIQAPSSGERTGDQQVAQPNVEFVHPNDALRVLLQFVDDNRHLIHRESHTELEKLRLLQEPHAHAFRLAHFDARDDSDDAAYWNAYKQLLPEGNMTTWSALESGLEKYRQTLEKRSELLRETSALRQQNSELKMLLHQYLNARVNRELQVPPARVFGSAIQTQTHAQLALQSAAISGPQSPGRSSRAPLPPIGANK